MTEQYQLGEQYAVGGTIEGIGCNLLEEQLVWKIIGGTIEG